MRDRIAWRLARFALLLASKQYRQRLHDCYQRGLGYTGRPSLGLEPWYAAVRDELDFSSLPELPY